MSNRELWDTRVPETMILLARDVSKTEQVDPEVINALHNELNRAITDSGGVQMSPIRHEVFYDIRTREHFYDIWIVLQTKGGWKP